MGIYNVPGLTTPKHVKKKIKSPVTGVKVGGRTYTRFSQIKVKPAGKKSLGEKTAGGIKLAIL